MRNIRLILFFLDKFKNFLFAKSFEDKKLMVLKNIEKNKSLEEQPILVSNVCDIINPAENADLTQFYFYLGLGLILVGTGVLIFYFYQPESIDNTDLGLYNSRSISDDNILTLTTPTNINTQPADLEIGFTNTPEFTRVISNEVTSSSNSYFFERIGIFFTLIYDTQTSRRVTVEFEGPICRDVSVQTDNINICGECFRSAVSHFQNVV